MGIDIEEARRGNGPRPARCAALLLNQGHGAEIWREFGGELAWTVEEIRLIELRHQQLLIAHAQGGGQGPEPKFPKPPIGRIKEREQQKQRVNRTRTVGKAQKRRYDDPEYAAEMRRRVESWGENWLRSEDDKKRAETAARMANW